MSVCHRTAGMAVALAVTGWLLIPTEAAACAVCYGDPDSGQAMGLNRAIWALLAVVGVVQVGFVAMFAGFIRRARKSACSGGTAATNEGAAE